MINFETCKSYKIRGEDIIKISLMLKHETILASQYLWYMGIIY